LKKKGLRVFAVAIILTLLFSTVSYASQTSSEYIAITNAYITRSGDDVNVYFYIVGCNFMDKIGATEIRIIEQNGTTWSRVKTFDSNDSQYTSAMIDTNSGVFSSHVTYTEGSASKNYYAIVYFYAEKDGDSDTIPQNTPTSYGS
jgi:hypothetical protein